MTLERVRIATGNQGKLREFRELLTPLGIEVLSMKDLGDIEIVEDGETFEANAIKKAQTIADLTGEAVLADDSGIAVDHLNGAPGVYSARYAGAEGNAQDEANNTKLLNVMQDVPDGERQARFVCALALCRPGHSPVTFEETFEGSIGYENKGDNGFGYDSIFVVEGETRHSAELSPDEKNAISHRGKALRLLMNWLRENQE
ncbi:MAG: XTP/dITP diphosphatase [Deltaproteobacteria bacterium]|nr:XTP/dITP diphosphatase [Deltaproteobacteria bacterium]